MGSGTFWLILAASVSLAMYWSNETCENSRWLPTPFTQGHNSPCKKSRIWQKHQLTLKVPPKIWQIWNDEPEDDIRTIAELDQFSAKWQSLNPRYQYKCLNKTTGDEYVQKRFENDEAIMRAYKLIHEDWIVRSDFLRYLVLLKEGGLYTDKDTDPVKPIDEWVPLKFRGLTNIVVGIEQDKMLGLPLWRDLPWTVQLAQFTFLTKPDHPILRKVANDVRENILQLFQERRSETGFPKLFFHDIITICGSQVFTSAVFNYIFEQTGLRLNGNELSNIAEPVLVADVLILPVNSFSSAAPWHEHLNFSGKILSRHKWMSSWVPSHPHKFTVEQFYIT